MGAASPPCRGDRPVAFPGAEGPLTLSTVEGSSVGRPTSANPSRPHSPHPHLNSPRDKLAANTHQVIWEPEI